MAEVVSRKYWQWMFIALVLSVGGVAAVFWATVDEGGWDILRYIEAAYLYLALASVGVLWLLESLRYQAALQILGGRMGFLATLEVHLASSFAANITPFSSGGPPVATYLMCRQGISLDKALTLVTMRLVLTLGFFLVAVPAVLILYGSFLELNFWLEVALLVVIFFLLGLASFFFYLLFHAGKIRRVVRWAVNIKLVRRFLKDPQASARRIYTELMRYNRSLILLLKGRKIMLALILFYTVLIWGVFFAIGPLLLLGLGLNIPVMLTVVRQVIFYFLTSYLPLPGGSGVVEVGLASLFASVVPKNLLGGFVAGWRLLTYHSGIIAGAPVLLRLAHQVPRQASGSTSA